MHKIIWMLCITRACFKLIYTFVELSMILLFWLISVDLFLKWWLSWWSKLSTLESHFHPKCFLSQYAPGFNTFIHLFDKHIQMICCVQPGKHLIMAILFITFDHLLYLLIHDLLLFRNFTYLKAKMSFDISLVLFVVMTMHLHTNTVSSVSEW